MKILQVEHLCKSFGGVKALDDLSFEVEQGMVLGLIGPNGAGKTTLFHCINGTLKPTAGKILWHEKNIAGLKAYQIARLGIVRSYQVVQPFHNMSTLQNAMVGAFCKTKRYHEAERMAKDALGKVGLDHKRDCLARHLNLGERKKLEIAKALSAQPELLLLDEVMAGLNTKEVLEMLEIIRSLKKKGMTIILIEHIMEAVMNLSDRIMVLSFGEKIAEGSPESIRENPQVIEAYFGAEEEELHG